MSIETVSDIISKWPSLAEFAADAGVSYEAAKKMRSRNSIPVEHWPAIISGASDREIEGVSSDGLMTAHTEAKAVL
jgi:hypothetical protein